jgi:hypothetical protein
MKLKEIIFTSLILFIGFQFCFSQEPQPKLFDSLFFPANCENVVISTYHLIDELEKNPKSVGYIIIYRKQTKSKELNFSGYYQQDIITLEIKKRNFNPNSIRIIRAASAENKIDFYIASDKSEKPNFTETKWNLDIPSKPIMFDDGMGGQLCAETPFRLNTFSEILEANKKAQGHFVIYADSIKDFTKEKKRITNEIVKFGIPLKAIKFFFRKDNSTIYPYAKLWFVPNNKK